MRRHISTNVTTKWQRGMMFRVDGSILELADRTDRQLRSWCSDCNSNWSRCGNVPPPAGTWSTSLFDTWHRPSCSGIQNSWLGSIAYSVAIGLVLKLFSSALQQKMIGENLSRYVTVRQFVSVNSTVMKAMRLVLSQEGLSIPKVAILIGGPDWLHQSCVELCASPSLKLSWGPRRLYFSSCRLVSLEHFCIWRLSKTNLATQSFRGLVRCQQSRLL